MTEDATSIVRRILVAADASEQSLTMLETAAVLAEKLSAELDTLFIEDADLIAWSGLPFSRILDRSSGTERQVNVLEIEEIFKKGAEKARQTLTAAVSGRNVKISFRVARGHYLSTALQAKAEGDALLLCNVMSFSYPAVPDRTATPGTSGVVIDCVYTGSSAARRALSLAAELATVRNVSTRIWLTDPALRGQAQTELLQHGIHVDSEIRLLNRPMEDLGAIFSEAECNLLVLPGDFPDEEQRQRLLRQLKYPAIIVS